MVWLKSVTSQVTIVVMTLSGHNYCMTGIAAREFISTCAGVGGGLRRIINTDISAGDDCPRGWRKETYSSVSFCHINSDDGNACSSANFSTNGASYQRVCGRISE